MQELSRKNALFTDSVIRRMTRVALDCGAINLAQGFPDFDPPKAMTDRLAEVAHTGPHQYPITMGAPNFREALARKCGRFMGRELDPNTDIDSFSYFAKELEFENNMNCIGFFAIEDELLETNLKISSFLLHMEQILCILMVVIQ